MGRLRESPRVPKLPSDVVGEVREVRVLPRGLDSFAPFSEADQKGEKRAGLARLDAFLEKLASS